MPDLTASPQRETEGIAPWMWGTLIMFALALVCFCDAFGPDPARLLLMTSFVVWQAFVVTRGPRPPLTPRVRVHEFSPVFFPNWGRPGHRLRYESRRRYRYPRHYHLRRRLSRRNPLLLAVYSGFLPWDAKESKAQLKHKWISNPRMTYGPKFNDHCASLDTSCLAV
jgi:hypothetical protein